ncbi:hypothetical protein EYR38_003291 [Pleurotus pulmonarius]|nr:hypothetical protein EYR38_003291 [Pleurotus pulmonarius]
MRFSNTVAFFAVAAIPVNVHAMNGNFSEKFEDALKNEFGARVFKGLEDRHCDTVTCALTIGKATPCLMKLAMDDNIGDVPKCLNVTDKASTPTPRARTFSLTCPPHANSSAHALTAWRRRSRVSSRTTPPAPRAGWAATVCMLTPRRFCQDLASDDEKTRARTWGFTPPPITDDL